MSIPYRFDRGLDWQFKRAADWQRNPSLVQMLKILTVEIWQGNSSWPADPPDLSSITYPTTTYAPGWASKVGTSGFFSNGPLSITAGKITGGGASLGWSNNPIAYKIPAPSVTQGGDAEGDSSAMKSKIMGPSWGTLCYYDQADRTSLGANAWFPNTDSDLATVTPTSYSFLTLASGVYQELIAAAVDNAVNGSSLVEFWAGYHPSDFVWG